ncbi:MAG: hypothetical protein R6X32_24290 [Chloroflexota bacterium]|jgi:hypothetical protein
MIQISTIHQVLSNSIWLFFLALGIWGLLRAIRGLGIDGSYMGAAVIGQLLFVVQAVLGFILWFGGRRVLLADPSMHMLYGVFALVFLPFVYLVWLRGDDSNRGMWIMGFATLFLFGIALRSITTGI